MMTATDGSSECESGSWALAVSPPVPLPRVEQLAKCTLGGWSLRDVHPSEVSRGLPI
jgi:hypothetical protein